MPPLADLLGESPAIRAVRATVERLLAHGVEGRRLPPLLIQGETGTGKGLLARAIHRAGPRSAGPLVEVNCAAIPETLLEAELFGFERGAFTDARQPKAGLFQTAHQGTLFLDEVGLLPEGVQAKLLKVLEDQTVRRLGSTRSEPADVALIAATSEDLRDGVRARRFREDLYHRLAVVTVRLPSLAERGPDILFLAEHFLARACADYGLAEKRLTPDARTALCAYGWPGNIRELANVMERAALLTDSAVVTAAALGLPTLAGLETTEPRPDEKPRPFRDAMGTIERVQLLEVLNDTQWNIVRAAARLQIPRGTLRYRIEKLGLTRSGVPPARAAPSVARTSPEPIPPPRARPPQSAGPWERRQLAFLRAALLPSSDRDARGEISRAPEVLAEKAESFGGHVEALGPLGLIAAFGLEPVEDAPRRAAHAAIAMRKAVERASPTVGTKIAIHASQGLVGQRGDGAVIDLTATSEAYGTLEALLKDAERDAIVVSPAVARVLERRFTLAPISQPAGGPGYRLEGLEQPGLTPRGGMTPLVGRESELEQVYRALARAETGHGQVVALVGEPGVGKSRLVWEIAHARRAHGWLVLQAGAVSYGTATPYLAVVNLLRAYFEIGDQDEPRALRDKVTQKLLALDHALEPTLPAFLALLDAPVEDPGWETLSPPARRQRTINALKQLFLRESQVQPLLVVVEDLHWIDAETQAALDRLIESLPAARLLLLVNYRPEYRHEWSGKTYYHQFRLDPLPPEQARELLETLLGGDVGLAPVKPLLLARTEGNPFFLEEGVRSLVDDGVLLGDRGAYQLVRAPEAFDVPGTVQAILAARIDRLPADDRDLLQIASVVGTDVPVAVLAAVAGRATDALAEGLARLQAAEFLYETSLVPDTVYTFKHALTHGVAYDSLLQERRRALHARIVEAIEALYPDRLAEHVEQLAHHAFRGESWTKAFMYLRQAGTKALSRSAYREAATWFEQALVALARHPDDTVSVAEAVDVRLELRRPLNLLGELDREVECLREAESLAEGLGDPRRTGLVAAYMALYCKNVHDYDRAIEYGHRALAVAGALEDIGLQVLARIALAVPNEAQGDYPRAIELLKGNIRDLQGDLLRERFGLGMFPSAASRSFLAGILAEVGGFPEGVLTGEEAIRIAESVDDHFGLVLACSRIGYLYALQGDLPRAISVLERGSTLCRDSDFAAVSPGIDAPLGLAYALSGRLADALPLLERSVEQGPSMGWFAADSLWGAWLGEAYLKASRVTDATTVAEHALDLSRQRKTRGYQAWALRLLGEIASRHDPPNVAGAELHYRDAWALASELGMRPLVAHCHLGLGKLYRRMDKQRGAQGHLTTAATMYREMGMGFWLEKAATVIGPHQGNSL